MHPVTVWPICTVLVGLTSSRTQGTTIGRRAKICVAAVLETSEATGKICRSSWLLLVWEVAIETLLARIPDAVQL
jgi:hypothetical protein